MKKFLLAFLAVVCLTCLGIAASACSTHYYKLYFNTPDGVNIVCEIPSGYEVKSGYKVNFRVELDNDAEGDPLVAVNENTIKADNGGVYSFTMKQDTVVTVSNVYVTGRYAVIFDKGDGEGNAYRVNYNAEYVDENGILTTIDTENPEGTRVKADTEVTFTIDVSVYYGENPQFEVLANTKVVSPSADGKYSTNVNDRVTVTIRGLELEDSFLAREDGGNGTASNPFTLKRPIDLYTVAYLMNSSFYYSQVSSAYYSLEADIDLKGEELFVIGADQSYFFAGDFNGNGHTISNYVINSDVVDQTDFNAAFVSNIGLFGVAAGAQIYDLNLENFTCTINAAPWDTEENEDYYGFFVGGVVAYGVGVNITNCSVSGTVHATAGDLRFGYIGGIIGYQMSAYLSTDGTRYYSAVRSCSSDFYIVGLSGCVYSAGGIAGCVQSYDETTPAMIINCYSTGFVAGAMHTGGIVGTLYSYGSVINCYATGNISAVNRLGNSVNYGDYRYSYSGGIVGDLGTDAVVANSFFTGAVSASASAGTSFSKSGEIAGNIANGGANGGAYIQSENGLVFNCASVSDKTVTINNDYIQNTLGWSDVDWVFTNGGYPTVNGADQSEAYSFTVTVNLKNGQVAGSGTVTQEITDEYYPMAYWYLEFEGHTLPEFLTADNSERSFGYYFDEELTKKVPCGYVPTGDITLYAAFADYSEVVGVYYLQWSESGSGKYIELTADGELIYRDGALSSISYYYYDGETITLRDTYIAIIDGLSANAYSSFKATVDENGVMTIWDNMYYLINSTESSPVFASKKIENFVYGKYSATGVEYLFNTDGTGVYKNGTNEQSFTYTVSGNGIVTSLGITGEINAAGVVTSMNNVALVAYDKFEGVWELTASSHKEYTFNGKGGWTYEYYGYDADGNKVSKAVASGTYTVSGDTLTLNNGTKFSFTPDGYLVTSGSVYYHKQYSYTGVWSDLANMNSVEITFNGVTVDGYGTAYIDYGANYGGYALEYDVKIGDLTLATGVSANGNIIYTTYFTDKPVIHMYSNDMLVAALVYREDSKTLWGSVYLMSTDTAAIKTFYLYDEFMGDWISNNLDVTFNGLGNYDVAGSAGFLGAKGEVTVTIAGETVKGTYTLEDNTLSGEFTYGSTTYHISYDEESGTVRVTEGSLTLQQHDEWYNVTLVDDSDNLYTFNGKGNIGAGVMTITAPDGTESTASYTGSTITKSGNDYKYGSTILYVYNGFTGSWFVSGTFGGQLVIGKFNATYTATGTSFGVACTFTYHPDGNYVTFNEPTDGALYYINLLDGGNVTELAVSTVNNTLGAYSVCTSVNVHFDDYEGEYEYKGGTLTLDGLANSVFTDGAAKYVKDGETVETYSYVIDEFGLVLLQSDLTGLYTLFYEEENFDDEDEMYVKNGVHYAMVLPDDLYGITADDKDGDGYTFYGNGKGSVEGTAFTYEIIGTDNTLLQYTLAITIDGETKNYVVDYNVDYNEVYYTISVATEKNEEVEEEN